MFFKNESSFIHLIAFLWSPQLAALLSLDLTEANPTWQTKAGMPEGAYLVGVCPNEAGTKVFRTPSSGSVDSATLDLDDAWATAGLPDRWRASELEISAFVPSSGETPSRSNRCR